MSSNGVVPCRARQLSRVGRAWPRPARWPVRVQVGFESGSQGHGVLEASADSESFQQFLDPGAVVVAHSGHEAVDHLGDVHRSAPVVVVMTVMPTPVWWRDGFRCHSFG
jgi:hypothetical protein